MALPSEKHWLHPFGRAIRADRNGPFAQRRTGLPVAADSGPVGARRLGRPAPGEVPFLFFGVAPRLEFDFLLPRLGRREPLALPGPPFGIGLFRRQRRRPLLFLFRGAQSAGRFFFSFGRALQAPLLRLASGAGRFGLFPQGFRLAHGPLRLASRLLGGANPGFACGGGLAGRLSFGFLFGGGLGQRVLARQSFFGFLASAFGLDRLLFGPAGLKDRAPLGFLALAFLPGFRPPDLLALPCGRRHADQREHVRSPRHVRSRHARRRRRLRFGLAIPRRKADRPNAGERQPRDHNPRDAPRMRGHV